MSNDEKSEGRFARWSRRKQAANQGIALEEENPLEHEMNAPEPEISEEKQAELTANRTAAEAIDLDAMDEKTDFSVFMREGVPEALKKRAMASLWRTNPVFANVDGLVDYGEDFGSPDLIMKTFQSAYQVGKGYLFSDDAEDKNLEEEALANASAIDDAERDDLETDGPEDAEAETLANDQQPPLIDEASSVVTKEDALTLDDESKEPVLELASQSVAEELQPTPRVSLRKRFALGEESAS